VTISTAVLRALLPEPRLFEPFRAVIRAWVYALQRIRFHKI
jgi:hypothetical protein